MRPIAPYPAGAQDTHFKHRSTLSTTSAVVFECETCGKSYKHPNCLAKHRWEHTDMWSVTSKLSLSKHQQVQLLEAASVLVGFSTSLPSQATEFGVSLPSQAEFPARRPLGRRNSTLDDMEDSSSLDEDLVFKMDQLDTLSHQMGKHGIQDVNPPLLPSTPETDL